MGYYLNVGAELGGPIIQDKLWFHIGYSPEFQKDNWVRDVRPIQAADSSNQNPAKDAFGNFIFGPSTYSDTNSGFAQTHQYTFKLSHQIDNNNRHSLGVRGSPTFFTGAVQTPFDSDAPSFGLSADPDSFKFGQWGGNVASGIYTYAGKYFNDKLKLDAVLGVHHQQDHWWPSTPSGDAIKRTYYYADPLMGLESVWNGSLPAGCGGEFLDKTPHCLARNYSKGGIGSFSDTQMTQISEKIMLTSLYDFAGLHQLKYGIDFEQLRSSGEHGYTGGAYYQFYDTQVKRNEYWIRGKGPTSKMPLLAQTLNWGAFVGDSWNPISNITINYGVRWEGQDFYGVEKPGMTVQELALQHKFNILDNWAPRAGVIWDFLGNGRGVVRLNYGRYFESIPMDLNQRAFGGEATRVQIWNVKERCAPGTSIADCPAGTPDNETILGGQDAIVAPGIKGQHSDELILSADYEPFPSWVFGVAGVYRHLGRVIEDMSVDGGQSYIFGNPGDFNINSLENIRNQINHTSDPAQRAQLERTSKTLARINEYPVPTREVWQLQFRLDKKITRIIF